MIRDGTRRKYVHQTREHITARDAYAVLGLDSGVDREHVHAMYRELALQSHPDRGGNVERFKELVAAYQVLQNRFQLEEGKTGQVRGECDLCGKYDLLRASPEGERCCPACQTRSVRRLILPSPPVVIARCAATIVLQCLALACFFTGLVSHTPAYGLAALLLGVAALLALAVTCATVVYTAEPTHTNHLRRR